MGIKHTTFFDVAPDPHAGLRQEGAAAINAFQPDCIIALGGGSAMDAGKIMWVMYEHPEVDFMDMAMRFMDIRKRVYTFPHMGDKATFIAVPTSAGTGSRSNSVRRYHRREAPASSIRWPTTNCCLTWQLSTLT